MSKHKFLIFMSLVMVVVVVAWSSIDALAQRKGFKDVNKKPSEVTTDDAAIYLGKVTPAEQKAAAKRARQLGLKPGIAGRVAQPVTAPAVQAPEPGGTR